MGEEGGDWREAGNKEWEKREWEGREEGSVIGGGSGGREGVNRGRVGWTVRGRGREGGKWREGRERGSK